MASSEEQGRVEEHLQAIRLYLKHHFPDYAITEGSVPNLHHTFTVMNAAIGKRHRLKVDWKRLSAANNTPENTRSALDSSEVASGMREVGNTDYYW
jgi:hypothetical protein